jgi:hypothetical protein
LVAVAVLTPPDAEDSASRRARLLGVTDENGESYDRAFGDLREVYLEDSWVLELTSADRSVRFVLDAVLTPNHRGYRRPEPGEHYCYRRAILAVISEQPINFEPSKTPAARDATGELDYGNIDSFVPVDWDGHPAWQLSGDWGTALIRRPEVTLVFGA